MLQFMSDVPAFVVRELLPFASHVAVREIDPDEDVPAWASSIITGSPDGGVTSIVGELARRGFRFEGWRPRPAISNPTYALAAARIEREGGSGSPAIR